MKANKVLNLLFLVLILVAGCATKRVRTSNQISEVKKDSVVYIETVRVDSVMIPGEKTTLLVNIDCDSARRVKPVKATLKGKHSLVKIEIDSAGQLQADCECLEYKAAIAAKDRLISFMQKDMRNQLTETETIVRTVSVYYKVCEWVAIACLILIAAYLVSKQVKFF